MVKLTTEEKKWRAESDAHTLIEAEAISSDKSRKSAAIKQVKEIAKDAKKRANAAEKVAKKKTTAKKRTTTRKKRK